MICARCDSEGTEPEFITSRGKLVDLCTDCRTRAPEREVLQEAAKSLPTYSRKLVNGIRRMWDVIGDRPPCVDCNDKTIHLCSMHELNVCAEFSRWVELATRKA